ncbi:UDP-N-acetylmuramoyl-L-alanyl-D-glutamate--2,6-diaminopimelate ligase [Desulforhopalus singaporensis]|uniref:Multifunctional fusion protein n=1 Tax=Desulforhopalus singaporensis TaxID=91360 RepID=A0A1H0UKF4_9BACT|nr:UDP-N-acetylmuramoyl-L-alanyl-D-glutamate--2,6-diaminopimelate ligase [Desulforhopalus singaporensis]SDP66573.1 UDP-N-acetylmuramoylalanyl-D-glutamate--2,6-diaminopimelate ligase /UDP-N-acetylmuramoyl-tripeptide--D-alanyl-D-alanine ligase [Desulforhopalus singaporensis]
MLRKSLTRLLANSQYQGLYCPPNLDASTIEPLAVTADSRTVCPGSFFVAHAGLTNDGHDFITDAAAGGAVAILCQTGRLSPGEIDGLVGRGVTVVETADTARAYGIVVANYYDNPAQSLTLVGITGTNGKTTVSYLVEQVLVQAGVSVGVIGTVNNRYTVPEKDTKVLATQLTTPDPLVLHRVLREMVDNGVTHVIMEVSSHALAQSRVNTLRFDIAAFTNLSRDHLDYHKDMDNYFQSKMLLFTGHLAENAQTVIPQCPESGEGHEHVHALMYLNDVCCGKDRQCITWGRGDNATISLSEHIESLDKSTLTVVVDGEKIGVTTPLVGYFNVENVLAAIGICKAAGIAMDTTRQALTTAAGAPGRLEKVAADKGWRLDGATVMVDYAHTPDALLKVLTTVKALPHGRLYCIFGCGGDRDRGKRPVMGAVAARFADVVIVTDDNPRSEEPGLIISEIMDGVAESGMRVRDIEWLLSQENRNEKGCVVVRQRAEAIGHGVRAALPGDIVIIAGKGHENYQLTRNGKKFFDDRLQARNALYSWGIEQLLKATGGTLAAGKSDDALLGEVVSDSRKYTQNGIFVALKGEIHDGHDHAAQAVANGCRCVVVDHPLGLPDGSCVQIQVADTTAALGDLAAFRRRAVRECCDQVVVGITGSCGKTTVKEMVAAIFNRKWPEGEAYPDGVVLKTKGNFNNLVGLPLSLLPLGVHQRGVILEMGMNVPGEIARLAEIADPDISCITNIHGAHLAGLGSVEGVARAKEELYRATSDEATLVVNLDDERIKKLSENYRQRRVTFSLVPVDGDNACDMRLQPDLWVADRRMKDDGTTTFTLHHGLNVAEVTLFVPGEHNVANALCAAAIGVAAGATLAQIAAGLRDFRAPDKRMQIVKSPQGLSIINDTYNANPASMKAGLTTLKQICRGGSYAVLGDMLELGDDSQAAHYDIGRVVARLNIDEVVVTGEFRNHILCGAVENGFPRERIRTFDDKEHVVSWLMSEIGRKGGCGDDMVLVKASRGLRFETIVDELLGAAGDNH